MKKKIIIFGWIMAFLVVGITTTVHAATFSNLRVTKLVDGETPTVAKYKDYNEALVNITYMSQSGKDYQVFIENEMGFNTTGKTTFNSARTIQLAYTRTAFSHNAFTAKMNISTAANNFTSGVFSGTWTPNHKD